MDHNHPLPPPFRPARPAAHVQAALARSVQPMMPAAVPHRLQPPPPPVVFRPGGPAPHVAAAQAKMAAPALRPPAPHVQAALGRSAQAKVAPVGTPTPRTPPPPAIFTPHAAPRTAPAALPRVVQRATKTAETTTPLPDVIRGMNRDGDTVKTAGGTWTATRYVALTRYNSAPCHGAFMRLEFNPEAPANATKIALVQSVTVARNRRFLYGNETIEARSVVGTSIDQAEESRSPLYADDSTGAGSALGSSDEEPKAGGHGYRYEDSTGWHVKPAWLRDTPHLRAVQDFSFQVFETTALAVAGVDAGTYYGSVKWGWWLKSDGDVLLVPLQVLSHGSVTDEFKASLAKWNETPTSTGETPQKLPPAP